VNRWWLGLAPAQATVSCAGHEHRLRWEAGALRALDHGDVESERTLAALGGERCTCVDLLEAWERHHDDLKALVLGSRGPTDPIVAGDDLSGQLGVSAPIGVGSSVGMAAGRVRSRRSVTVYSSSMGRAGARQAGWTAYGPSGRASQQAESENELFALLGLGGGLPERLQATVAAAWRERLSSPDRALSRARPQLRAALHGRVFAAMRTWLGGSGLESELRMIDDDDEPSVTADDGVVHAELPFGWLVDVWAKDLATIWGRFCVAAATDDGRTWRLVTVGPDLGAPSLVQLQLPSDAAG
jgi:hypothetical protein